MFLAIHAAIVALMEKDDFSHQSKYITVNLFVENKLGFYIFRKSTTFTPIKRNFYSNDEFGGVSGSLATENINIGWTDFTKTEFGLANKSNAFYNTLYRAFDGQLGLGLSTTGTGYQSGINGRISQVDQKIMTIFQKNEVGDNIQSGLITLGKNDNENCGRAATKFPWNRQFNDGYKFKVEKYTVGKFAITDVAVTIDPRYPRPAFNMDTYYAIIEAINGVEENQGIVVSCMNSNVNLTLKNGEEKLEIPMDLFVERNKVSPLFLDL